VGAHLSTHGLPEVGFFRLPHSEGLMTPWGYTALRSRVRTLLSKANWTAETTHVCRHDVIEFFETHHAASLGVTPGTFATYKSDVLKALDVILGRQRARNVSEIGGAHGALHDAITDAPVSHSWKLISGPFLLYLHDRGIALSDITTDVLADYYAHHRPRRDGRSRP